MTFQNLNLDSSEVEKVWEVQHPGHEGQVLIHLKALGHFHSPVGMLSVCWGGGGCPLALLYRFFKMK